MRLLADATVEILSGEAYLFDAQNLVSKEMDLTALHGLPVFSQTEVSSTNAQGFLIVEHEGGQEVDISGGQSYAYLRFDLAQEWIATNVSEKAGLWYARLYPFNASGVSTKSNTLLLISGKTENETIDISNEW